MQEQPTPNGQLSAIVARVQDDRMNSTLIGSIAYEHEQDMIATLLQETDRAGWKYK
jgi:hypothetical protein